MTGPATPSTQEGPTQSPPHLPEGWLAQWEGQSKRYYYVQRATGISTWDIPTQPAPSVPTPGPTPQQGGDPFSQPSGSAQYGGGSDSSTKPHDGPENYQGADRSFLSDLALNAATGGNHKPQKQSGLTGLASSFLGGQGSHGSGGHSGGGGGGGIAGQLVGSLLGGGKPAKPGAGAGHGGSSSGAQGGLMGMASSFLGGHQNSSNQNPNYGYSSGGHGSSSGGYSAQAPPTTYQPPGQQGSSQYGASSGQYNTPNPGSQNSGYSAPSAYGQGGAGTPHGQAGQSYSSTQGGYGQPNPSLSSPPPTQYGGSGSTTPAYGQSNPSYPPHAPDQGYGAYSGQGGQQQHYPPPPPQSTPSYQGQPGGFNPYGSQHGSSTPGQYPPTPSPGYPGQQNYGGQAGPTPYGQQQQQQQQPPAPQGGYGQQGGYGGGGGSSGGPPAPGWR